MAKAVYEDDPSDSMQGGPEEGPAPSGAGDIAGKGFVPEATPTAAPSPTNFKSAFAAARAAGDKTFEFGGKKFTTEVAGAKPTSKSTDYGNEGRSRSTTLNKPDFGNEGRSAPKPELKYESLQDREAAAEKKRRESGRSFYGSTDTSKPRTVRGMRLPEKTMAKGGMTASSRADGIAMKGKTRGKMY